MIRSLNRNPLFVKTVSTLAFYVDVKKIRRAWWKSFVRFCNIRYPHLSWSRVINHIIMDFVGRLPPDEKELFDAIYKQEMESDQALEDSINKLMEIKATTKPKSPKKRRKKDVDEDL